jgi:hypothetical protein
LVELLDEFALLLEICLERCLLGFGRYRRGRMFEAQEEGARMLDILHPCQHSYSSHFEIVHKLPAKLVPNTNKFTLTALTRARS